MEFIALMDQTFDPQDVGIILVLILLEGVLSVDNALVLGLLAGKLPGPQQKKALLYGLVGAFVFRLLAIALASFLLAVKWVKLLGGGYLIYIAIKHFFFESKKEADAGGPVDPDVEGGPMLASPWTFWSTVAAIELTDVAFAVDSILAAIALVQGDHKSDGVHPKLWVVITGGFIGVVLLRFAASVFIGLLKRFPRLEESAYFLVLIFGIKLCADYLLHAWGVPLNFHSPRTVEFWLFWPLMAGALILGFMPAKGGKGAKAVPGGGDGPTGGAGVV